MNTAKAMDLTKVEILNQDTDSDGKTPSYYRMLADKTSFKYITIDPGIYEKTLGSPPIFAETTQETLPSITPLWHPKSYSYLSLDIGKRLRANVYIASSPEFKKPVIAKFAQGHGIGPEFLGYLTEEGRVIGFLIEHVEGRHATISDLPACEGIVKRLHGLGVVHGDLNKHNFLISEKGAVLIDFETAKKSGDSEGMEREVRGLEGQLLDESGNGGTVVEA
ncbi:hypothetical protein VE04_02555 [Pseudogymnoascus sp. 24MN13]|nr:hypothetical protein VE04_02555 [Pseudogymnoascus sp. 24MN13]